MINYKIKELLQNFNDGNYIGSKIKLAKMLGVTSASVSQWCLGQAEPSQVYVEKMAKIFNKSCEQIREIFTAASKVSGNNSQEKENYLKDKEIDILKEKIKVLEDKVVFLQEQVDFYKQKSAGR